MGSGKMENWVVGRIPLDREVNRVNIINFLIKTNIPVFHHSIIPCAGQKLRRRKKPLFSISCTNSDTFNYFQYPGLGSTY